MTLGSILYMYVDCANYLILYHSLLGGHDGVVNSRAIIAAAHQTQGNIPAPMIK